MRKITEWLREFRPGGNLPKKNHLLLILLAGILLLLCLGMVGLVLWAGIGSGNGKLVLLGIVLAAGFAAWLVSRIRRLEKGRRRK